MRAYLVGSIVELEKDTFAGDDGRQHPYYGAYIKEDGAKARDAAQRVRISAEQYGGLAEGETVEWPVIVEVRRGGTGFRVTLDPEHDVRASLRVVNGD